MSTDQGGLAKQILRRHLDGEVFPPAVLRLAASNLRRSGGAVGPSLGDAPSRVLDRSCPPLVMQQEAPLEPREDA
jgi:hypothetical protein